MKRMALIFLWGATSLSSFANDLFPDGNPIDFTKNAPLEAGSTLGGYSVYPGDSGWRYIRVASSMSNTFGESQSVKFGTAVLYQLEPDDRDYAVMSVQVNLTGAGPNVFFSGSPCSGTHAVAVNKGQRKDDNCLTIDVATTQVENGSTPFFDIHIVQSKSAGRIYVIDLRLTTGMFGFHNTSPADWSAQALEKSPARQDFLQRLASWAGRLQDASERALDFSQPKDAFDKVPSYRTLIPSPKATMPEVISTPAA